jgi:hypothetical protein
MRPSSLTPYDPAFPSWLFDDSPSPSPPPPPQVPSSSQPLSVSSRHSTTDSKTGFFNPSVLNRLQASYRPTSPPYSPAGPSSYSPTRPFTSVQSLQQVFPSQPPPPAIVYQLQALRRLHQQAEHQQTSRDQLRDRPPTPYSRISSTHTEDNDTMNPST